MKKLFFIIIIINLGCAANIMQRKDAYQAFPVSPGKFEDLKSYTLVIFKANPVLLEAERGNAWYMVLRHPNGEVEKHVAVLAKQNEEFFLVTVIPTKLINGTYAVLLSHDAQFYFNAKAQMYPRFTKLKKINWQETATLLEGKVVEEIKAGTAADKRVKEWFSKVAENEVARRLNTVLVEEDYKRLKQSTKSRKVLREIAINGVTFGIIFGEVFAFTKSWSIALANATLMETVRLLGMLFQINKPNLNFPEYGSSYATKWDLAEKVVSLEQQLLQLTKVLEQYVKVEENFINAVDFLKVEIAQQRQKIEELEKAKAVEAQIVEKLREEIEKLREEKKKRK